MVTTSMKASFKGGALVLAAATVFSVLPLSSAEAQYYHRRHTGEAIAGGVVGGLVGGLAAGAILNANRPPVYAGPVYAAPPPVVVEEVPVYQPEGPYLHKRPVYWARPRVAHAPDLEVVPTCYMSRQRVWLDRYTYTHRYTRVCD